MSDLINQLSEMGADSGYNMTEEHNKVVRQLEAVKKVIRIRQPETAYSVGDKVIVQGLQNADIQLRCETAGTTAAGEINGGYDNLEVGQVINDGTVSWAVVANVTIPDIPDAPVTSVNGKTGDVNITAEAIGAEAKGAVSNHNTAENAHKALFDGHASKKASTAELGHVKVDGNSIKIDENGIISADIDLTGKANINLANVTNPTQAFKTMAIGWGMPDYTAGVDISSRFATAGSSYTVPYDCCMCACGAGGEYYVHLYRKSGCNLTNTEHWQYVLLWADEHTGSDAFSCSHVYLPKGMVIYNDSTLKVTGNVMIYPLKGADK